MRRSYAFAEPRSDCARCMAAVNTRLELFMCRSARCWNKVSLSLLLTVRAARVGFGQDCGARRHKMVILVCCDRSAEGRRLGCAHTGGVRCVTTVFTTLHPDP